MGKIKGFWLGALSTWSHFKIKKKKKVVDKGPIPRAIIVCGYLTSLDLNPILKGNHRNIYWYGDVGISRNKVTDNNFKFYLFVSHFLPISYLVQCCE